MKKVSIILGSLIIGVSLLHANSNEHSSNMKCGASMKTKEKQPTEKNISSMNTNKKSHKKKSQLVNVVLAI